MNHKQRSRQELAGARVRNIVRHLPADSGSELTAEAAQADP